MSWLLPRAAAVVLVLLAAKWALSRGAPAPTEAPAEATEAPTQEQPDIPHSFIEACGPLAVAAPGRKSGDESPLVGDKIPRRPSDRVDPAVQRLGALTAVDEVRARLGRDPRNPALHRQLGDIYLYALGNRTAAVQHLCRALIEAPTNAELRDALLAAWMQPGAELELEVALRASDRSLPWREALNEIRALPGLTETAAAGLFDEAIRAQRIVRTGAGLRRERTKAALDGQALIEAWSKTQSGDFRVVASVQAKDRARVAPLSRPEARASSGVQLVTGFNGRVLVSARGEHAVRDVLAALAALVPDRQVILFARRGAGQLMLSLKAAAAPPGLVRVTAFATDPEDPTVRETLVASPPDLKPTPAP